MRTMWGRRQRRGGGDVVYLTNSRNGSSRPDRAATRDMVVLSPPGMIRASHLARSDGVRTSGKIQSMGGGGCEGDFGGERREAAERRRRMCSWKAPWRARTPTVMGVIGEKGFFWGAEFTRWLSPGRAGRSCSMRLFVNGGHRIFKNIF